MAWRLALPLLQSVHVMLELVDTLFLLVDLTAQVCLTGRFRSVSLKHERNSPHLAGDSGLTGNGDRRETRSDSVLAFFCSLFSPLAPKPPVLGAKP